MTRRDAANPPWDVVIVGARVAGASTALLLARAGLRVLVLDRARRGSDTVSTHALMRPGVLQLSRWGLLDDIVAAGTPPIRRTTFHYDSESISVTIRPSDGVDALYAPRRTVLDAALVAAAAAAGATFRFATPVAGLVYGPGGRVIGVRQAAPDGGERVERAGLVVGADGRGSLVAQEVGAALQWSGAATSSVLYGYWSGVTVDGYDWWYRPGASAGAIPTNDGLTCLFVGAPGSAIKDRARDLGATTAFLRLAPEPLAEQLTPARLQGRLRAVTSPRAHLRQAWGAGWALVGDAGYWKDPLSTHGMTAALRDADLLARALISAPRPGPKQEQALADYQRTRDRLSLPMLPLVERIGAYAWDLSEIRRMLKSMAALMSEELETLAALPDAAAA
jgi:2-polyprenyl-6-methoxyphenol hydroxylase-like FAD-dependent oxidoreductase